MSIGSERKADSALQELNWGEFYTSRFGRYSARLIEQAREAARSLRKFPNRGRVVPEAHDQSVREPVVKSHRLIYEIRPDQIVILAFIYGFRQIPQNLR